MSESVRRVTVDEIETGEGGQRFATLVSDDGDILVVPLGMLPVVTGVGVVLSISFEREPDETDRRRSRISDLQKRLFGDQ
jgi:hypothetical protein